MGDMLRHSMQAKVDLHADEESAADVDGKGTEAKPLARRSHIRWTKYVIATWIGVLLASRLILSKLAWLEAVVLTPAVMCLWLVVEPRGSASNLIIQRVISLAVVLSTISSHLPSRLAVAITGLCILWFGLSTVPVRNAATESAVPVVTSVLLMIVVLLIDNFCVWVVAATFTKGRHYMTAPFPLQDNGKRLVQHFLSDLTRSEVVSIRRLSNAQWTLVAALGASLVMVDVVRPNGRTLYRLGRRAVLTLASARAVRIVSFCLTVLPSQSRECYTRRFPVPPEDWVEWIMVGMRPYTNGGCNDLIVSGHAVVLTTLACVSASVGSGIIFQSSIWLLVAIDFLAEIYEGFHYSVDMWLGTLLVVMFWKVMSSVEDAGNSSFVAPRRLAVWDLPVSTVAFYTFPVATALAQMTLLPREMANAIIVIYALTALGFLVMSVRCRTEDRATYQHRAQHTLLTLLFLALGIYL